MYSPKWLFLYPGLLLLVLGLIGSFVLLPGEVIVGQVGFDIHTFAVACVATLVGVQAITFAVAAHRFATAQRLLPPPPRFWRALAHLSLEQLLIVAGIIAIAGFGGLAWCVLQWASVGFGPLEYSALLRVLVLSVTALAIGVQLALTAFLAAIIEIPTRG